MRDGGDRGLDPDLIERLAEMPAQGQRWLKTVLVTIRGFDDADPPREAVAPVVPVAMQAVEEPPQVQRPPADLEDVISGKARLEDQLEAYPELAEELEGLSDVIDLLREAGQARRRKGEDVLRELGLVPPEPDPDPEDEDAEPVG
jgi:hypothetical protein